MISHGPASRGESCGSVVLPLDQRAAPGAGLAVADDLRAEVERGELTDRLPGELELGDQYGVSRDFRWDDLRQQASLLVCASDKTDEIDD